MLRSPCLGTRPSRCQPCDPNGVERMGNHFVWNSSRFGATNGRTPGRPVSGIQKVRYTHSGMEATLLAIRLATAWTGKKKIVKFDGHYHGSFDQVLINVNPSSPVSGAMPVATSDSYGLSEDIVANTLVLPFNDLDRTAEFLRRHHAEIGAVILEPVQAGYIPPDPEFLKGLREVTRERKMDSSLMRSKPVSASAWRERKAITGSPPI